MIFAPLSSPTSDWLEHHHAVVREALAWIRAMPANAPDGITELRGTDLYVNVHGYSTLPADECRWESHRHTVDIQYCIAGGEVIEVLPPGALTPRHDYVAAKDTEFWHPSAERPTQVVMTPGSFVLFLTGELHRPKIADGTHLAVRKLVVKIHAPLLGFGPAS